MELCDRRAFFAITGSIAMGSLVLFTGIAHASLTFTSIVIPGGTPNLNNNVFSLHVDGTGIYAGSEGGLSISANGGASWQYANPANVGSSGDWIYSVQQTNGTIYATAGYGVYTSSNGGASWTNIASRDVNDGFGQQALYSDTYVSNGIIYVAGLGDSGIFAGGVLISSDGGTTWQRSSSANGLSSTSTWCVFESGGTIYAGTASGLSVSTNSGSSWSTVTSGLGNFSVRSVDVVGSTVYLATDIGVCISMDGGSTWAVYDSSDGLGSSRVRDVAVINGIIYASTESGFSVSGDGGISWTTYTTADGLGSNSVNEAYVFGGALYVATSGGLSIANLNAVPSGGMLGLGAIGLLGRFRRRRC